MKLLSTLALALLSLSFFAGCSEDSPSNYNYNNDSSVYIKEIFPLAIGNQWTYFSTAYLPDGSIYRADSGRVMIDSAYTLKGIQGFMNTSLTPPQFLYYSGSEVRSFDMVTGKTNVIARYPMAINETITIEDTLFSDGFRSRTMMRIASENTKVTVPAGTFTCVNYEIVEMYGKDGKLDTSTVLQKYFSKGVGRIKSIYYNYLSSKVQPQSVSELIHYSLK